MSQQQQETQESLKIVVPYLQNRFVQYSNKHLLLYLAIRLKVKISKQYKIYNLGLQQFIWFYYQQMDFINLLILPQVSIQRMQSFQHILFYLQQYIYQQSKLLFQEVKAVIQFF
ncbi:hypothetical protein TTHERM_000247169 (macronuclear) [Tetrahymena thermophila SB210]|uniref:Uncharacterized protein n=1 Tax=Tetrahymena thermophila (strain SB210) TaxID=312017 RepID=W7X3Q2_TETTS|nr:hypothetical protein TTHERM_000247169 [Tetrahymena thermophila SB210]EWS72087.1 hypothetical protein TTHERM_000247169 [Tetrahymena thermophila SB210]|eukprot:XP_012655398.1 hypothetical protein TTHERM_000247169 [Tetrahymena thermophila SB210]